MKNIDSYVETYTKSVNEYHKKLSVLIEKSKGGIRLIHQDGLKLAWRGRLCDGVNLHNCEVPKYLQNIKSIILKQCKAAHTEFSLKISTKCIVKIFK